MQINTVYKQPAQTSPSIPVCRTASIHYYTYSAVETEVKLANCDSSETV